MYTNQFLSLKEEYQAERGIELTHEQFAALLYTMPSILIANSDGKIDEAEGNLIKNIPASLISGYRNDHRVELVDAAQQPDEGYMREVKYLINHQLKWQERFLDALREELKYKINDKNTIYDIMWKAAYSSHNVDTDEVRRIKKLTKALGF